MQGRVTIYSCTFLNEETFLRFFYVAAAGWMGKRPEEQLEGEKILNIKAGEDKAH